MTFVAAVVVVAGVVAPSSAPRVPGVSPTRRVTPAPQTITFAPLPNVVYGHSPFDVSATTSANDVQQGTTSGSMSNDNTCASTLRPVFPLIPDSVTTIPIVMSGSASPDPHLGDPITLSNTQLTVTVPSTIYLDAYESGLIADGQVIPAEIDVTIAGSHTEEGTRTETATGSVTLHVHDPDGIPLRATRRSIR